MEKLSVFGKLSFAEEFSQGGDPVGIEVEGGTAVGVEVVLADEGKVELFDFEERFDMIRGEA